MGKLFVLIGWVVSAIIVVGDTYKSYTQTYTEFPDSGKNDHSLKPVIPGARPKDNERPRTRGDSNTPKDTGPRAGGKSIWDKIWDSIKGEITGDNPLPDTPDVPIPAEA